MLRHSSRSSWRQFAVLLMPELRRSRPAVIRSSLSSFAGRLRWLTNDFLERTDVELNGQIPTSFSSGSEFSEQRRRYHRPQRHLHGRNDRCRALHNAVETRANVDATEPTIAVLDNGRFVVVRSRGGCFSSTSGVMDDVSRSMRFNATWLRHSCQCELCVQKSSGQKLIRPAELASRYHVESAEIVAPGTDDSPADSGVVRIRWREDNGSHVSEYPIAYLVDNEPRTAAHRLAENKPTSVISTGSPLPTVDYDELEADIKNGGDQRILLRWLHLINEYGACLLRRVPVVPGQVNRVAEMICPVQTTIYGDSWHVRSDPNPINVAYSDAELDFHMDLSYYESPPGIQFLHCVRFDRCVEGGESLFVDAWHVAETMRTLQPDEFRTLTRIPATFQKIHFDRDRPVYMTYRRPHIVVEPQTENIIGVNWAPAFEGPLDQLDDIDVDRYYEAYSLFARLLNKSPTRVEMRLEQGDLVCFNNRRILHARHAFDLNGGSRHLNGCYVNIDEFKSRLRVLVSSLRENVPPVRSVFNQSWS